VVRPEYLKENYTPAIAGEIRATTLTIDDFANSVVYDVKDTLNAKQNTLNRDSPLNINSLHVKSDTTSALTNVAGQIACDSLVVRGIDIDTLIDVTNGTSNISFRASASFKNSFITAGQKLKYDLVKYNHGDGYQKNISNTFTAPVGGVYYFSLGFFI